MAIASRDALVTAMAAGVTHTFMVAHNTDRTFIQSVNYLGTASGWLLGHRAGTLPASFGNAELCTSATRGAVPLPTPTAGNQWYLAAVNAFQVQGLAMLLDRLCQVRTHANSTSSQTFTLVRPPRSTTAHGVMAYLEMVTSSGTGGGAAAPVFNVSYTNSDGVAGRAGVFGGTSSGGTYTWYQPGGIMPMQMADGDRGVASIQSITAASAATGFAYVLSLCRPLWVSMRHMQIHGATQQGWYDLGGTPLGTDPCVFAVGSSEIAGGASNILTARFMQG